jgi:hypothetical protein
VDEDGIRQDKQKLIAQQQEALNDVKHWVWSWQLQLSRLVDSTNAEWSGGIKQGRPKDYSRTTYDEHALVLVGWNVGRAIKRAEHLFPEIKLASDTYRALRLLRNLYEHWDEQRKCFREGGEKKRAAKEFVEAFPQGRPWSITYGFDDWTIGAVLPVRQVTKELGLIEELAHSLEEQIEAKQEAVYNDPL